MRITTHPGLILKEDFMEPFGLSATKLASDLRVPANRISEIIREKRSISIDTAERLSYYFGNSVEFWMGLQNKYDISYMRFCKKKQIDSEVRLNPVVEAHKRKIQGPIPVEGEEEKEAAIA